MSRSCTQHGRGRRCLRGLKAVEASEQLILLLLLLHLGRGRADGAHLLRELQAVLVGNLPDELVDLGRCERGNTRVGGPPPEAC